MEKTKKTNPPAARIIFSGTELLTGKLNTYTPLFAQKLGALGISVKEATTVGDSLSDIAGAAAAFCKKRGLVIIVGGLGPTFDDLSREGAAKATGRKLLFKPALLKPITQRFRKLGLAMPGVNSRQAMALEGARIMPNRNGTAPGQYIVMGSGTAKTMLMLLPGPAGEWMPMFDSCGIAAIKKFFPVGAKTKTSEIKITGTPESQADELLRPVMNRHPKCRFTILAAPGDVRFFTSANGPGTERELRAVKNECLEIFKERMYGEEGETLESAVGKILKKKNWTAATAESCTGGLVSHRITEIAGSSDYFKGAVVAYSNEVKQRILGVRPQTLKKHGAVSAQCALEMARGARKTLKTDCAVSTTGIAGPGGATPLKPVGLVFMAVSFKHGFEFVRKFNFPGSRSSIKLSSSSAALNLLRLALLGRLNPADSCKM